MLKKLMTLVLAGALVMAIAAPARAKTGEIDRLLIRASDGKPVEILGSMLNAELEGKTGNLFWPLLNGSMKGHRRPPGSLGPAYEITYVFPDVNDDELRVREIVYLEADPPLAFAPKGQTTELYPGDVREVPWGWRPFPQEAATAIVSLMKEAARPASAAFPLPFDPFLTALFAAPLLLVVGGTWFLVRRSRRASEPAQ